MKYIGVADVRNPHADARGHGGISCRQIPIHRAQLAFNLPFEYTNLIFLQFV
jgi:hypothetical protein